MQKIALRLILQRQIILNSSMEEFRRLLNEEATVRSK